MWNLATHPLAEAMNASCAMVPPEVDEFDLAGLESIPSQIVKPPRVALSPVTFECKLTQQFPLLDANGEATSAIMTFGEVVCIHIDDSLLQDGIYQTVAADPIMRGGGAGDYFTISEAAKFVMLRPR